MSTHCFPGPLHCHVHCGGGVVDVVLVVVDDVVVDEVVVLDVDVDVGGPLVVLEVDVGGASVVVGGGGGL